jgi:hypothetical protein
MCHKAIHYMLLQGSTCARFLYIDRNKTLMMLQKCVNVSWAIELTPSELATDTNPRRSTRGHPFEAAVKWTVGQSRRALSISDPLFVSLHGMMRSTNVGGNTRRPSTGRAVEESRIYMRRSTGSTHAQPRLSRLDLQSNMQNLATYL